MMKNWIYSLVMFCLGMILQGCTAGKQPLSVLYVGGSADMELYGADDLDSIAVAKSVNERMASFKEFLEARFASVKIVKAEEYRVAMSDEYDVTVFDACPNPIRPERRLVNAQGRSIGYQKTAYLPDDFDRPVLCIANYSDEIGRSIGTKNDWFCLCLNAHAHSWKKNHPVFQGPFQVDIESEMRPTPVHAFEYTKMTGEKLPAMTEMWAVQNTSNEKTPGYRIGMVSRSNGYLDSPDTEMISGGESAKNMEAVAIGRHGNFFHWGFSGSPAYLTEAGKAVLANSIVYIAKFNGQHVIARKLNDAIATRHIATNWKFVATRECWQEIQNSDRRFYQMLDSVKLVVAAKRERGEELTGEEKMYADVEIPRTQELSYTQYLQRNFPALYPLFKEDAAKYAKYYDENLPWFHPNKSGYDLEIDEDVKQLGIANNDLKLLDTCIAMWERGEEVELATRVLHRYTLCRFATPQEWRNWFETYKEKMFFTESGGWLWLINTLDRSVPGNDYSILNQQEEVVTPSASTDKTDKQNPVALSATINKAADGSKELVVRMKIHPGFHTYAQVAGEDPFIPTELKIELPDGYTLTGNLQIPAFKPAAEGSKTTIYEGDAVFRQKISGMGKGEVKCIVCYQCCDASICFPPVEEVLKVQL